jgi:hypothetical protein
MHDWAKALTNFQVCADAGHIWQFPYLRGLDGSKPRTTPKPQRPVIDPSDPESALEALMQQQRSGQRADGDAQLDYVVRLAEYLKAKDHDLKNNHGARIIAFGLAAGSVYDKLILLRELRQRFPESVFFITDLDARLWTPYALNYTHQLLVGSAYFVFPSFTNTYLLPTSEEFPPFRDVYQVAMFKACCKSMDHLGLDAEERALQGDSDLDAEEGMLQGGLYKIGRYGPIKLLLPGSPDVPAHDGYGRMVRFIPWLIAALLFGTVFFIQIRGGTRLRSPSFESEIQSRWLSSEISVRKKTLPDYEDMDELKKAVAKEHKYQLSVRSCICIVLLIFGVTGFGLLFLNHLKEIANTPGEEPWDFLNGVTIWPSELIRIATIIGAIVFIYSFHSSRLRRRETLYRRFFRESSTEDCDTFYQRCLERWTFRRQDTPASTASEKIILEPDAHGLWEQRGEETGNDWRDWFQAKLSWIQERHASSVFQWMPPFIKVFQKKPSDDNDGVAVSASALFRSCLNLGRWPHRVRRVVIYIVLYLVCASLFITFLHDAPSRLLIRGTTSHWWDMNILLSTIVAVLFCLFLVLDATMITKRALDYISRHPTSWPQPVVERHVAKYGVSSQNLDGLLDVQYTALQTEEVSTLMFGPIFLLLLLALSRAPCFDNWTWPAGIIVIYVVNFLIAGFCWFLVRQAAARVRKLALHRLDDFTTGIKSASSKTFDIKEICLDSEVEKLAGTKKQYLKNLKRVRKSIVEENGGAYSKIFQDPTYLAVFIPSSLSGIIYLVASFVIKGN